MAVVSRTVEIALSMRDGASKALKGVGKMAGSTMKSVQKLGSVGSAALKGFAMAATGLNQSIELFKKGAEVFRMFTDKAREYRGENDELIKSFDESNELVGSLAARIGDTLLVAFTAIVEGLRPVIQAFETYLDTNRKILAIQIVDFLEDVASVIVNVVGKAMIFGTRVVAGFQLIWELLFAGITNAVEGIVKGIAFLMEKLGSFASLIPGIGDELKLFADGVAISMRDMVDGTGVSIDEMSSNMNKIIEDSERLEFQIGNVTTKIQGFVRTTAETARTKVLPGALGGVRKLNQELDKTPEKTAKANESLKEFEITQESIANVAGSLTASMGTMFASLSAGGEQAQAALSTALTDMLTSIVSFVEQSVIASQIMAMSGSGAAASFGGPIAIIAATALVAAFFKGLISQIPEAQSFASGGMVRGGVRGRDSVPALLMPGEYVMNTDQVDAMRSMFSNMDGVNSTGRFANGGTVGGRGGGVTINVSTAVPLSKAELTRYVRSSIVPALNDLRAQGIM